MSKKKKNKAYAQRKTKKCSAANKKQIQRRKRRTIEEPTKKSTNLVSNPCSMQFKKIVPELKKMGWHHYEMYNETTATGIDSTPRFIGTQALLLQNNSYSYVISSYEDGVNISKIEVWGEGEDKIKSANKLIKSVLSFLKKESITNVYAITKYLGHFKEENVILNENELNTLFDKLEFIQTETSGVLKLSNIDDISKLEDFDDSLLFSSNPLENASKNYTCISGEVQVYFEFVGKPLKNFVSTIYVGSDDEIKNLIKQNIGAKTKKDEMGQMFNSLLLGVIGEDKRMPKDMVSQLFQSFMAITLMEYSKEIDYQNTMSVQGSFLTSVLHLLISGNANNISQYKFVFDEKRETMDIATR